MPRSLLLLLACSFSLALPSAPRAEEPIDPVRVLLDHPNCESGVLQMELYSRDDATWSKHPEFPVLATGTCIVEDAGGLLNEIRTRCYPLRIEEPVEAWRIGVPVFEPGVIDACKLPQAGALKVAIRRPASGAELKGSTSKIEVRGQVERVGEGGTDHVQWLGLENLSLQTEPAPLRVDARGNFRGTIELAAGANHIRVTARDFNEQTASHGIAVMFDPAAARSEARAAEQERIDRIRAASERTKNVTIKQAPADDTQP